MVFSKLRVVVTCVHRLFSRKSVFYGRCVAQNWTREQSRDLLAVQPAFLWLYSSSSSNNTPLRAACDPLYPHSFPAKKKKNVLPVPCPRFVPFLVPTETHNFVHFYWVASYFIQTGCSVCQVPSLNCSHVSLSACRLLGLDVTRASGQLAPSLTPSGASRRIEGKTEPQQTPIQRGLAVHLPQCPLFLSFPSVFMPKEKCPLPFS